MGGSVTRYHLAILQAVPRSAREVQWRRCKLLQDRNEPDDEVGVRYGCVSVKKLMGHGEYGR